MFGIVPPAWTEDFMFNIRIPWDFMSIVHLCRTLGSLGRHRYKSPDWPPSYILQKHIEVMSRSPPKTFPIFSHLNFITIKTRGSETRIRWGIGSLVDANITSIHSSNHPMLQCEHLGHKSIRNGRQPGPGFRRITLRPPFSVLSRLYEMGRLK